VRVVCAGRILLRAGYAGLNGHLCELDGLDGGVKLLGFSEGGTDVLRRKHSPKIFSSIGIEVGWIAIHLPCCLNFDIKRAAQGLHHN
jgi:hypothetical protein